jgi:hypothetical protein
MYQLYVVAFCTVISVWIYIPWGPNPVNESQLLSRMYNTVIAKMRSKAIGWPLLWNFYLEVLLETEQRVDVWLCDIVLVQWDSEAKSVMYP